MSKIGLLADTDSPSIPLMKIAAFHKQQGDEVKFVIADYRDFANALDVMKRFSLPGNATVLFAPVFGAMPPDRLVEKILKHHVPARLNLQLHKFIWGADAEGV